MTQPEAMFLSILLEAPVVVTYAAVAGWVEGRDIARLAVLAIACTLLTHPLLWEAVIWGYSQPVDPGIVIVVCEAGVIAVEAGLYSWMLGWQRGVPLGLGANVWSVCWGLLWF